MLTLGMKRSHPELELEPLAYKYSSQICLSFIYLRTSSHSP